MADSQQIFQTSNPSRWQRLKWGSRIFFLIFVIAIIVIGITLKSVSKSNDKIPVDVRAIKKVLAGAPTYRDSDMGKEYKGFRKYINSQWAVGKGVGQKDTVLNLSNSNYFSDSLGVRAAFYMSWNPQSTFSLRKNINKLNLVLPEWFFIDPQGDTLITKLDKEAFDIIKRAHVKMIPLLSNSINNLSTVAALSRVIENPAKRERLITDILKQLNRLKLAGINIDLEDVKLKNKDHLNYFEN